MMNKQRKSSGKSKGTSDSMGPVVRRLQSVEGGDDQLAANNSASSLNGTYMNACFVRAFFAIYGREVEVTVKNGAVYHGILYTMSERGEIVLKCVHRILGPNEDPSQAVTNPSKSTLEDFIAFTSDLIVQMVCKNVNLQPPPPAPQSNSESSTFHNKNFSQNHVNGTRYAAGNTAASAFLTDTEVTLTAGVPSQRGSAAHPSGPGGAPYMNGVDTGERELLPWCPEVSDANNGDEDIMDLDDHACNGWTAEDMLKTNRENCGVEDCEYDESKYTLPLDKNSENYQKNLNWANEKAREMQESMDYSRVLLETNVTGEEDEEAMFSAVDRSAAAGDGMGHHRSPSRNNSSIASSATTPPSDCNNTSATNSLLSSSPGNNVNLRDFTMVQSKRGSNRSGRGANAGGPVQHNAPVPLINSGGTGGGLPQRNNYRSGKHGGANMGPGGGSGSGPGARGGPMNANNNAPQRFVSRHNQQKTAIAALQQQQQTFNNSGANSNNGDSVSSQPHFGYSDSAGASQNHKQQGPPQTHGAPNSAYNPAPMPPNQGRMNKEQNLKNFSKNIQLRDPPASHSSNQSSKALSSGHSSGGGAVQKINPSSQATSPLSKHAHTPNATSSPSLSPNTRQGLNNNLVSGPHSDGMKQAAPHNAWNRPPQIHNNTSQMAPNCLPGAVPPVQQLPSGDMKTTSGPSHGNGSPPSIARSNSSGSKNSNNVGKSAGGPTGGGHLSKKRSNENSTSSEKQADASTAASSTKEGPVDTSPIEAASNEDLEKTISNDTSVESVPVKELSLNEDVTEIVKNSKLNVKAQEFKPSGNFFSPTDSQQEVGEESSVAMGAAGLNSAPPMYYPQNAPPIDSTMVSPHFAMMATSVPGSQAPVVSAHSHVSAAGSSAGGVDEAQAQALVASSVPFAGPSHVSQYPIMHIHQYPPFAAAAAAAGMSLHGQPMPGPGGNSGTPTALNMFQTVPQVPLQQVSTTAPHLQAGVPAIAPRHMTPFGPHIPVSGGHGIPVQFASPVANVLPHHPNVGANSGVPNSGVGVGSGVSTLNNTSSPTFQNAKFRPRGGNYRNSGPQFYNQNNNAATVSSLVGPTGQHVPMQTAGATSTGGVGQMQFHPVFNPNNGSNTPGAQFYQHGPLLAAQGMYPVVGPPPAQQGPPHSHVASQQLSLSQSGNSSVSNGGTSGGSAVSGAQQSNPQQMPPPTVAGGGVVNYFPHPNHHNTVTVPSMYQASIYNQQVRMAMPPTHGVLLDHGVANLTPQFVAQTIAATGPSGTNQPPPQQSQPGLVGGTGASTNGGTHGQLSATYNNSNTAPNFSQQQSQVAASANNPAIGASASTASANNGTAPGANGAHQGPNGNGGNQPGQTSNGVVPTPVVMAPNAHAMAAQQLVAAVANRAGGAPAGHAGPQGSTHPSYPMQQYIMNVAATQHMAMQAQAAAVQQMQLQQQQQHEHHHRNSLSGQGAMPDYTSHRGGSGAAQDRGDK